MTVWHILTLIGCSLVGFALREFSAISKRPNGSKLSWAYYWTNNRLLLIWNAIGVIALLACSRIIFYVEAVALKKFGVADIDTVIPMLFAPTGIIIGYFGAALVRKLLKKSAEKVGLEDVFAQVEETIEDTPDGVKQTTTTTTIISPQQPPPEPKP